LGVTAIWRSAPPVSLGPCVLLVNRWKIEDMIRHLAAVRDPPSIDDHLRQANRVVLSGWSDEDSIDSQASMRYGSRGG
jgi:hypothetical protein